MPEQKQDKNISVFEQQVFLTFCSWVVFAAGFLSPVKICDRHISNFFPGFLSPNRFSNISSRKVKLKKELLESEVERTKWFGNLVPGLVNLVRKMEVLPRF